MVVRKGALVRRRERWCNAVEQFWPANNLVVFFLQIALCLPSLVACDWRICLNASQRVEYVRKFSSTLGRVLVRT
jgi:hypothetical protein